MKKNNIFRYPPHLLPSLRAIPFVCPRCRGSLRVSDNGYRCDPCDRAYMLVDGIPDFRLFPDPYLDLKQDLERSKIVIEALSRYDLQGLLEYYWSFSDVTPEVLRRKFIQSVMLGELKAERILQILKDGTLGQPVRPRRLLEIGSGTGNFLAAAANRFEQVVGVDIAMRWLHVSRRRFMDRGMEIPPLVCCCGEHLPFPDGYFDLAVSSATLEFTRQPENIISECDRTLQSDGSVYISTVNRFSITQDPYVYLWGIGFLPRSWHANYARWRRNASYENIKPLSLGEVKGIANKHFTGIEITLPDIDNESLERFSWIKRLQIGVYRILKRAPIITRILIRVSPQWDIMLSKAGR